MNVNNLIRSAVVGGVLVLGMGAVQAQQMMMTPQQQMAQQQMMQQQMMQQQMMQQQMMQQQQMKQQQMKQQQMNPLAMLKLSEEQQKQLKEIASEAQKKSAEYMKSLGESAKELQKLATDAVPDAKVIGEAYAKMFDIQRQIIEAGITTYNKEIAVFTDEQRKLWDAMRKQMQGTPQTSR